jgi:hypothetical protein
MTDTLERVAAPDVHLRSDGRTVFGIVVPFNAETRVDDGDGKGPYTEIIRQGAFAKTIRERGDRIKLVLNHDKVNRLPVGVGRQLEEQPSGLYGEFHISDTREGNDALTLVRDGVVDAFSVGFNPIIPGPHDPLPRSKIVERTEVRLDHAALVGFPAYDDARVLGIRYDFDAVWSELTDDERNALDELDLLALIRNQTATSDEAADGTSEEADDDEPPTDAERSAEHSDATHQLRSVLDRHRDISEVARRLAKVTRN